MKCQKKEDIDALVVTSFRSYMIELHLTLEGLSGIYIEEFFLR